MVIPDSLHIMLQGDLKKIYDDATEDIFDVSNEGMFKEIEKKKMGDVYTCYVLVQLSSVKCLAYYHAATSLQKHSS